MDNVEKIIFKDINNVISLIKSNKSLSMFPYLHSDLESLYSLCNDLNIKGYPLYTHPYIPIDNKKFNYNASLRILESYIKDLDFSVDSITNVYNFYNDNTIYRMYDNIPKIELNIVEIVGIVSNFLENFDKRYYEVYKELYDSGRLICSRIYNDNELGITEFGYTYPPYIAFENTNSILTATTIIHEVAHAFSYYLVKHKKFKDIYNRMLINTQEICSYTIELFFIEYLEKIHFNMDDTKRLFNEYNFHFQNTAKYCYENFVCQENIDIGDDSQLTEIIPNFYGKELGFYLFGLGDKKKAISLVDQISIQSCYKVLPDIIKDNNMDYDDIVNFKSGKRLILEKWSK